MLQAPASCCQTHRADPERLGVTRSAELEREPPIGLSDLTGRNQDILWRRSGKNSLDKRLESERCQTDCGKGCKSSTDLRAGQPCRTDRQNPRGAVVSPRATARGRVSA